MAVLKKELKDILDRYGIDPHDKAQIWDCHGTLVLYHKAYEVIAAKESIAFDPPIVLEANGASKSVALCVVARMGDRSEWATGEAAPGNNKNAYPYAMAEKRAKDRVVAKLVGLAQYVYSEDEADEFKDAPRQPVEQPAAAKPAGAGSSVVKFDADSFHADALKQLAGKNVAECRDWWRANKGALSQLEQADAQLWMGLKNFCSTAGMAA